MTLNLDPQYIVNLVLCALILAFGLIGWQRSKKSLPLYIGIAFGIFGLSHLATILGLKTMLEWPLIIIRTLAYLLVVYALYEVAFQSKKGKSR